MLERRRSAAPERAFIVMLDAGQNADITSVHVTKMGEHVWAFSGANS